MYRLFAPASFLAATLLFSLPGCDGSSDGDAGNPPGRESRTRPAVVATIFPLADLARSLGGDDVSVLTLLPPGANPHSYEFRPGDVRALSRAAIVLTVGGGFEPWVDRALAASTSADRIVLRALDHVKTLPLVFSELHDPRDSHGHEDATGGVDPHFWLDPERMAQLAPHVTAELTRLLPEREAGFQAALEAYQDSLASVDREVATRLEPLRGVRLLSLHAAWGYFADRYGLRIEGVLETFPGQEPGPLTVAAIVRDARAMGVRAIVAEPQQSTRLASVLADDLGIPMLLLDPVGGEGIEGRETYTALLRWNAGTLARHLHLAEKHAP